MGRAVSLLVARIAAMHRAGGGGGVTYTALNPADKSPYITLSEGDLKATGSGSSNGIVRSVAALAGKRYFEAVFLIGSAQNASIAAGVAKSTASLTASLGYSASDGWAMWGIGPGARHGGVTAASASVANNDVVGFAVDATNGKMWIRKNGIWLASGDPGTGANPLWTDLAGTLFAAACPWISANQILMRFDPATFRDPAPADFDPVTA